MTEQVVNIHADGRLAYTGLFSHACTRQGMKPADLLKAIENGWQLQQPNSLFTNDRFRKRAKSYIATFRS